MRKTPDMYLQRKKFKTVRDLCTPCPDDYYADDNSYKTYRFKSKKNS